MKLFKGTVSHMLCCFSHSCQDESRETASPGRTEANRDTPLSTSVHNASVPHAVNSPDALHKIFASNSSTRGYNAVRTAPPRRPAANGSLDLDFRFGPEPQRKPQGRLEQLTSHVKQKLSESRLSRSGEQQEYGAALSIQLSEPHVGHGPDVATRLLGQSQNSIGLSELLASRAASEGGYDSDAKSMRTPTILSAAGSVPGLSRQNRGSLATTGRSQADGLSTAQDDSKAVSGASLLFSHKPLVENSLLPRPSTKNPFLITTDERNAEFRADALRCVSNSISTGPTQAPSLLEQRIIEPLTGNQMALEHLDTLDTTEGSKVLGENVGSSDDNQRSEVGTCLRLLDGCGHAVVEKPPVYCSTDNTTSDPNSVLVERIEKTAVSPLTETTVDGSPPITAIKVCSKISSGIDKVDSAVEMERAESEEPLRTDLALTTSSEAESLHLFDMRISRTLANSSRALEMSSVDDSDNKSSGSLAPMASSGAALANGMSLVSRGPTFIAIEPTRRPSDPETKKLFESSNSLSHQTYWKRSLSDGSLKVPNRKSQEQQQTVDDSSSVYGSVNGGTLTDPPVSPPPSRRGSLKNPNSMAIGGRSASGPMVSSHITTTGRLNGPRLSKSAHSASMKTTQDCVKKMPKRSKFIKVDSTPTPMVRRSRASTDRNEELSEIDVDHVLRGHREIDGSESTQAIEDRRNENISDVDLSTTHPATAFNDSKDGTKEAWLSQGRRTGWGFDFTNKSPKRCGNDGQHDDKIECHRQTPFPTGQLDASDVWCKAFKRLGEPIDHGRLLATPQFDREGRRKCSMTSNSDQIQDTEESPSTPVTRRRSRSADFGRGVIHRDHHVQNQRRRSAPVLVANKVKTQHKRPFDHVLRIKKRSLTGLHHRLTAGKNFVSTARSSQPGENLGVWGRFASHTREKRNGPAGLDDQVTFRDFEIGNHGTPYTQTLNSSKTPSSPQDLRSHRSWNLLKRPKLYGRNTKSMTFAPASAERARMRSQGVLRKVRRLYRTKSSELHTYMTQGHRGSVSTGLSIEFPELECLPGEVILDRSHTQDRTSDSGLGGAVEQERALSLDTISEATSKRSKSVHSHTIPWSKRDAEEWSKVYQDCVGSFSALRSDDDVGLSNLGPSSNVPERRVFSLTSVLRDSTVDFKADLERDVDKARERLLRQLQSSDEKDKTQRMPGSFV